MLSTNCSFDFFFLLCGFFCLLTVSFISVSFAYKLQQVLLTPSFPSISKFLPTALPQFPNIMLNQSFLPISPLLATQTLTCSGLSAQLSFSWPSCHPLSPHSARPVHFHLSSIFTLSNLFSVLIVFSSPTQSSSYTNCIL